MCCLDPRLQAPVTKEQVLAEKTRLAAAVEAQHRQDLAKWRRQREGGVTEAAVLQHFTPEVCCCLSTPSQISSAGDLVPYPVMEGGRKES